MFVYKVVIEPTITYALKVAAQAEANRTNYKRHDSSLDT